MSDTFIYLSYIFILYFFFYLFYLFYLLIFLFLQMFFFLHVTSKGNFCSSIYEFHITIRICVAAPFCVVSPRSFHESQVVMLLSCPSFVQVFEFFTTTTVSDCCCSWHCYIFVCHCCGEILMQKKKPSSEEM